MDGRVDQYALAIVTYELLRGRPTWRFTQEGGFEIDPIEIIVHRPLVPDAPVGAGTAIKRAISKDPAFRFVSASEFVRTFSGAGGEATPAEQTHHTDPIRVGKRSRAWFLVPAVLALVVLAMRFDIRSGVLNIVEGRWPFRKSSADSLFDIDTTIADISLPADSAAGSKSGNRTKRGADSTKRRGRSGGEVAAFARGSMLEESALIVTVDDNSRPTVLVDGQARGRAPLNVRLSAGQHLISLRGTTRYSPKSWTIIVAAGDTARAKFTSGAP
jgi:hypothetical protein